MKRGSREKPKHKPNPRKAQRDKPIGGKKVGPILVPGKHVIGEKAYSHYIVDRLLGSGGFAEVYKVSSGLNPDKKYAMKTERIDTYYQQKYMRRLKCEVDLFKEIALADSKHLDRTHFLRLRDRGCTRDFRWILMDLFWFPLNYVVDSILKAPLSAHALVNVARQTLKALESLHELGYLHRDVKPGNFAFGLPPKDVTIYLFDFGIARYYRNKDGALRVPRKRVRFVGTFKYASVRALDEKEQARVDDLESWLYMMIELHDPANLPWRNMKWEDKADALAARSDLMTNAVKNRKKGKLNVPAAYVDIIARINSTNLSEQGDYRGYNVLLDKIVVDEKIDMSLPLDWVGKCRLYPELKREAVKEEPKNEDGSAKKNDSAKEIADNNKKTKDTKPSDEGSSRDAPKGSGSSPGERSDRDDEDSRTENSNSEEAYEDFLRWKRAERKAKKQAKLQGARKSPKEEDRGRGRVSKLSQGGGRRDKDDDRRVKETQKDTEYDEPARKDRKKREEQTEHDNDFRYDRNADKVGNKRRERPVEDYRDDRKADRDRKKRGEKTIAEETHEDKDQRKKRAEKTVADETREDKMDEKDRKKREEKPADPKLKKYPEKKAAVDIKSPEKSPVSKQSPVAASAKNNAIRKERTVEMKK